MSAKRKLSRHGLMDLPVFVMVVGITLVLFIILNAFGILSYAVNIKGAVDYVIESESEGSVLVSIMQAEYEGKSYSEMMGRLCFIKTEAEKEAFAEQHGLKGLMEKLKKKIKITSDNGDVCYMNYKEGEEPNETIRTQIPLPGSGTGVLEIEKKEGEYEGTGI